MTSKLKILALLILAAAALAPLGTAQEEDEFDPQQAVRQIKKDLDRIVEKLAELNGDSLSTREGKRVVDKMNELLRDMQGSQNRVVKNIDELIKSMKKNPNSSSGGEGKSSGSQQDPNKNREPQKKRDRNQKPKDQKRQQKQDKSGKKPAGKPSGKEDKRRPKQGKNAKKQPDSGREVVPVQNDAERWGNLPAEVRQLLIERNFRDYFPDYESEIKDYLKSLKKRR